MKRLIIYLLVTTIFVSASAFSSITMIRGYCSSPVKASNEDLKLPAALTDSEGVIIPSIVGISEYN